jgi:voltage-gated potassium channel
MPNSYYSIRRKVFVLLHPELGDSKWDKIINGFIILLILLNVLAVVLETVPSIHDPYALQFHRFDQFSVAIFTIEYILRVWSSVHDVNYKDSLGGRVKYMVSWGALIDLLAILPFYIHLAIGLDLRVLRILRLMRFLRLFRLTQYMRTTRMVINVFRSRAKELFVAFIMAMFLILIAASLVYFAEHIENPKQFSSIPKTIWWAVVSLTTVGYGDMIPITPLGQFFTGAILIIGVAILAIPAGIITAGFLEESRKTKGQTGFHCPHCGRPISEHHFTEQH